MKRIENVHAKEVATENGLPKEQKVSKTRVCVYLLLFVSQNKSALGLEPCIYVYVCGFSH